MCVCVCACVNSEGYAQIYINVCVVCEYCEWGGAYILIWSVCLCVGGTDINLCGGLTMIKCACLQDAQAYALHVLLRQQNFPSDC